jgi:hypothetical protein
MCCIFCCWPCLDAYQGKDIVFRTILMGPHTFTHGSQGREGGREGGGLQPIRNNRIKHVQTPIILYK